MTSFNYFGTPVGPEYKKKFARNVGIALLVLFSFYGVWSLIGDLQEPETTSNLQFKEKYSDYGITEYPDSKGIPWKYSSETSNRNVELILGKERVILRSFDTSNDDLVCTIVNPFPKDIEDYCPPKW